MDELEGRRRAEHQSSDDINKKVIFRDTGTVRFDCASDRTVSFILREIHVNCRIFNTARVRLLRNRDRDSPDSLISEDQRVT